VVAHAAAYGKDVTGQSGQSWMSPPYPRLAVDREALRRRKEPIHASMDVAGGADEHDFLVGLPMNARRGVKPKILPDDVCVTRRP
jgi:hypothetical protein